MAPCSGSRRAEDRSSARLGSVRSRSIHRGQVEVELAGVHSGLNLPTFSSTDEIAVEPDMVEEQVQVERLVGDSRAEPGCR